jgi:hypothetical protein
MAYLKPDTFTQKVANPIARCLVPVNVLELDGSRYLVAARGDTEWARNLRAAGGGELRKGGRTEEFRATEVPVDERAPIIAAYRDRWDREVKKFYEQLTDPSDHPTFRIEKVATPG